jgi:hypothetical protein
MNKFVIFQFVRKYARHISALVLIGLTLILVAHFIQSNSKSQYTRSQCMVKIDLIYAGLSQKVSRQAFFKKFPEFILKWNKANNPTPHGYGFPIVSKIKLGTPVIYFAFGKKCDQKYDFAENIMSDFLTTHPATISYSIYRYEVHPGQNTLNFVGQSWKDGTVVTVIVK